MSDKRDVGGIPAFVTAGGRISGEMARRVGSDLKAMAHFEGQPLLARIIRALRDTERVGRIVVVGPPDAIAETALAAGADAVVPEGSDGAENLFIGLEAHRHEVGGGHFLFAASDLPFLDTEALHHFLDLAEPLDADIVYPIVARHKFEAAYPGVPKTYARLTETEFTGGSVMRLRAESLLRSRPLIEKVYQARKSTIGMAGLLGWYFALRFALGRLTVPDAEARASVLTGCKCVGLRDADPRIAYDMDDLADYEYALNRIQGAGIETGRKV